MIRDASHGTSRSGAQGGRAGGRALSSTHQVSTKWTSPQEGTFECWEELHKHSTGSTVVGIACTEQRSQITVPAGLPPLIYDAPIPEVSTG